MNLEMSSRVEVLFCVYEVLIISKTVDRES